MTPVTNTDLLLYALYRLGGAGKYVDVEDVFMEMWRLTPGRSSWRKYRQPNYKIMSQAIADLMRRDEGSELLLGAGDTRQLSAGGVRYVESLNVEGGPVLGRAEYRGSVNANPAAVGAPDRDERRVEFRAESEVHSNEHTFGVGGDFAARLRASRPLLLLRLPRPRQQSTDHTETACAPRG